MAWDTADHHLIILLFDGQHDDASLGLRGRGRFSIFPLVALPNQLDRAVCVVVFTLRQIMARMCDKHFRMLFCI